MKKIIYTFMAFALLAVSSCEEKHLDVEQKGVSNIADFYKTDGDAKSAVTAMYADFATYVAGRGYASDYCPLRAAFNCCSDDINVGGVGFGDNERFASLNQFRYGANNEVINNLYKGFYKSIYSANLIIHYIGDAAETQAKKDAVAQARVIRAYDHMMLAIGWGNPPLVDHLLEGDEMPEQVTEGETVKEKQNVILNWCVAECEAAMADLPDRNGTSDKEGAYRVTKGFALAVAGKAALFCEDYDKAISNLKPLVESSNYALVPGEIYRNLFHVEGDGCEEKIFEVNVDFNAETQGGDIFNVIKKRSMETGLLVPASANLIVSPYYGRTGEFPASGVVGISKTFGDKFLGNDGDSYRRKATFLTKDEFFCDENLQEGMRYDGTVRYSTRQGADESDEVYAYRDSLFDDFKASSEWTGCWSQDTEDTTLYYINLTTLSDYASYLMELKRSFEQCPAIGISDVNYGLYGQSDRAPVKQMVHKNDLIDGVELNGTNCTIMRLGEAYLLYAEACLKKGNDAEAKKYINKIQERAGSKTVSSSVDMTVLKNEKQYELWMEGCRWADLVRWGDAKTEIDKKLNLGVPRLYDRVFKGKGQSTDARYYVEYVHELSNRGYSEEFIPGKHEFFPIPQEAIDRSQGHLTQNPGW